MIRIDIANPTVNLIKCLKIKFYRFIIQKIIVNPSDFAKERRDFFRGFNKEFFLVKILNGNIYKPIFRRIGNKLIENTL